jgi:hypothetical protein
MNTNILKFCVLLLLLCGAITSGCEQDGLWEIFPDSETTVVQNVVDGIEFKFCLLDEAGETATVFNEGENFTFYFSVTNKRNEKLYFDPGFAYSFENNFCRIFNTEDEDLGKPFIFKGADEIGLGGYPFEAGEKYIFEESWVDVRYTTWRWGYGYFESSHQEPLKKGNYYTEFKYQFNFTGNVSEITDSLTFKINFKIQ